MRGGWALRLGGFLLALALVPGAWQARQATAQPAPTLVVQPAEQQVEVGGLFSVTLGIEDAFDLAAFQFDLRYDAQKLRFVGATIGPFLASTGRPVVTLDPRVQGGVVTYGAASGRGAPGPSGAGVLAVFTLEAIAPGDSVLALEHLFLRNSANEETIPNHADGQVTVIRTGRSTPTPANPSQPTIYLPSARKGVP